MRVGSLFSGIGGIELGFERAGGFETAWFVEWDAYAQAVLRKHWPGVPVYGDVRSIEWSAVPPIDVLTGGFPCQPHSVAGKRRASKDERDLWPECRRAIEALKPKACVFENVPGLLTSEKGEFFKRTIDDFYRLGYRPRVYRLSARAVGAPHLRKRVFIVAFPLGDAECTDAVGNEAGEGVGTRVGVEGDGVVQTRRDKEEQQLDASSSYVADSIEQQRERWLRWTCRWEREPQEALQDARERRREEAWMSIPESLLGRVAYGVPSRVDRLKCLGNAVVPQVAEVIARIIKEELQC